ncbi:MAG: flap structure-specific endonuclease, partial [Candidatus Diapherotrites archaeon]|nr:flap structure-specific endonuclease [Candidatus Diapherotrites archaeon]
GSKELLQAMGVPVIQAPSEGEAQAAVMCARGEVWAAGSQDFDSLLFGAPRLIRNITITGRRKVPRKNIYTEIHPELLDLEEVLNELGITREKLIWIGLLVGTDFNDKIPGVGPKTALKLVKEHDSFDKILEATKSEINYDPQEIQDLFLNIDTTKDYKLEWKAPDRDKITEFLVEKHDFSPARVNNSLSLLEKSLKTTLSQGRLDSFFG